MFRRAQALLFGLLLLVGFGPPAGADEKGPTDHDVAAWVRQRVRDWQPTAADRPFDEIGWAKDIREAERLASEHDRPVFLFTHDGHMAIGRC
jgi:hypothetical protein